MSTNEQENRVLGGLKATLHNPNTSTEAKDHAAEVFVAHGVEVDKSDLPSSGEGHAHDREHDHEHDHQTRHSTKATDEKGQEEGRHEIKVLSGYKAALANAATSQMGKKHAAEVLKEHGL
ncbi:MAG: hypothetical protein TREMPRED_001206 [Tremellales sp. Tagirdzhanova-0007]|nr:MAG: hypothetical protein TREMPRED_001206 [Tremellales sp. Tagirdzhanova-0007]